MYYGWVQLFLYGQLLLWLNLYHSRVHFNADMEQAFNVGSALTFITVLFTGLEVGYFTNIILLQYIVFVYFSVRIYNNKFEFKKAVCLGFLTVFLNSFYWEFFYHVYEFQIWIPYSLYYSWWVLRVPQWLRVVPAFFVVRNFNIVDRKPLMFGLVVSFILTYINFTYAIPNMAHLVFHFIHRVLALGCLVKTIYEAEVKDHTGVKYAW